MAKTRTDEPRPQLDVDPLACAGIGLCAHLAPNVIALDRWGYPVVPDEELNGRQQRQASRAVRGCPRKALSLG